MSEEVKKRNLILWLRAKRNEEGANHAEKVFEKKFLNSSDLLKISGQKSKEWPKRRFPQESLPGERVKWKVAWSKFLTYFEHDLGWSIWEAPNFSVPEQVSKPNLEEEKEVVEPILWNTDLPQEELQKTHWLDMKAKYPDEQAIKLDFAKQQAELRDFVDDDISKELGLEEYHRIQQYRTLKRMFEGS